MLVKKAFILIGDDKTGKTTFQKYLIWHLCKEWYARLDVNLINKIIHRDSPEKLKTLFTSNRSLQEKMDVYKSIPEYFQNHFKDADICVLSSHVGSIENIEEMIYQLRLRYYNVNAVFFSNHLDTSTASISTLSWDERIFIKNPNNPNGWENQIDNQANNFSNMIIMTSNLY
jgi:hypothetical protein